MTDLRVNDVDATTDDDDLTHWECCLDAHQHRMGTLSPLRRRSFCGIAPSEIVEGSRVDCVVCIDLASLQDQTGICPVRHSCCPQYDDICEDS